MLGKRKEGNKKLWTDIQKATNIKQCYSEFNIVRKYKNKDKVCHLCNEHHSYVQIYTDASQSLDNKIEVAFTDPEFNLSIRKRISDELSIYMGVIIALLLSI